jgi:hypothetical protein
MEKGVTFGGAGGLGHMKEEVTNRHRRETNSQRRYD